jgi:hypothetical protein
MGILSINFLFIAYSKYRSDDFVIATNTSDFATKGTCIESVTDEIVDAANFIDASWDCAKEKDKLARLLLSQTHSIYYLHTVAPSPEVTSVSLSLLSSTIGTSSMSINASMAYSVLRMLDDGNFTVPKDCSSIYSGSAPVSYDTLEQELPTITCAGALTGSNPTSFSSNEWGKLHFACNKQFYFGSSGPHADTYGIPLLNEPPGPNGYRWPTTAGFNSTSPWSVKSRMFLGFRFGWSLWAYVPSMLALACLTMDAMLMLLTETTIQFQSDGMDETSKSLVNSRIAFKRKVATYIAARNARFTVGSLMVLNSIVWMIVFVWTPWGVWTPRLGRPICDEGVDAEVDPSWAYIYYKKTRGGWKSDAPCLLLEVLVIASQIFFLFAMPASRLLDTTQLGFGTQQSLSQNAANARLTRWVSVFQSAKSAGSSILLTVVGLVLIIIGNAFTSSTFGNAWARAVADESVPWKGQEAILSDYIYDMNLGVLVSILAGGFILSVVVGRWMFESFTCESLQVFLVWITFAIGSLLIIILFHGNNYFTDKSEHIADCGIFPQDGDYDQERASCEVRFYLIVSGLVLLGIVIFIMSLSGLAETVLSGALTRTGQRIENGQVAGEYPGGGNSANESSSAGFRNVLKNVTLDGSGRALLSSSPPPYTRGTLQTATRKGIQFTLNPNTIAPVVKRSSRAAQ